MNTQHRYQVQPQSQSQLAQLEPQSQLTQSPPPPPQLTLDSQPNSPQSPPRSPHTQLDPDQLGKRLLEAAKKGDVKEADSLLLFNADIHYKDPSTASVPIEGTDGTWEFLGCTALHWAAVCNRVEMITFLAQRGADIDRQDDTNCEWTPLHWATILGKVESTSSLLHNKAYINCRDKNGWTPLHLASNAEHIEVVAILLHHNADMHSETSLRRAPLHYASFYGHTEVVALLLHCNADIHDEDAKTLQAARHDHHQAVVELLLAAKGKDNDSTTFKWTEERVEVEKKG